VTLGLDIGGANTKAVLVTAEKGKVEKAHVAVEYFPVWKQPEKLKDALLNLKNHFPTGLDGLGVTMTAELCDCFKTKREGVEHILGCVKEAFPDTTIFVLTTDAQLESVEEAVREPLRVAAANWAATGWLVAKRLEDCVVVDVGSTSTSIIPIVGGCVAALGKTDLDKLMCGELVYTGSLRTNVAAIVQSIPLRDGAAGVSSELFASSGDVHLVLSNISPQDYICETADGRGKTLPEAQARLSRVVCADTDMLTQREIADLAHYVWGRQVEQIASGLGKVYGRVKSHVSGRVPVVVTGLGKDFLARKAAETVGADAIVDLGDLLQKEAVAATPAFAVALMAAQKVEGEIPNGHSSG
jgi:(4-(4-[2-(gamma-L-glutamylamino)ethyl]phenoxymethyl)furan-2-yl)methanamine synthase